MNDPSFDQLATLFTANGNTIERIPSKQDFLFSVLPFVESFLGWDRMRLSHFTLWDCLPIADLSENDVLTGGVVARSAVEEAVAAMKVEEDRVTAWKLRHGMRRPGGAQMEWL